MPPNILSLHGLHDIATYDSLLLRQDKTQLEGIAGISLMPPENGNLMRIPSIEAAISLGANWIVLPQPAEVPSGWDVGYSGTDMTILHRVQEESSLAVPRQLATTALRLGMFLTLLLSTVVFLTIAPARRINDMYSHVQMTR